MRTSQTCTAPDFVRMHAAPEYGAEYHSTDLLLATADERSPGYSLAGGAHHGKTGDRRGRTHVGYVSPQWDAWASASRAKRCGSGCATRGRAASTCARISGRRSSRLYSRATRGSALMAARSKHQRCICDLRDAARTHCMSALQSSHSRRAYPYAGARSQLLRV